MPSVQFATINETNATSHRYRILSGCVTLLTLNEAAWLTMKPQTYHFVLETDAILQIAEFQSDMAAKRCYNIMAWAKILTCDIR